MGKKKDKNPRRNSLVAMAEAAALSGMGGNDENVDVSGGQGGAGLLSGGSGSMNMNNLGLSVNPNQHYEMLKLHHMNLLNEIQETTLMMNLYQQQQLQQQQQQLQQQDTQSGGNSDQMALLLQQQGMGGQGRIGSLGLGGVGTGTPGDMQALLRQQQQQLISGGGNNGVSNLTKNEQNPGPVDAEDEAALQQRLQDLKEQISRHQKEAEDLAVKSQNTTDEVQINGDKRKLDEAEDNELEEKRAKIEGESE